MQLIRLCSAQLRRVLAASRITIFSVILWSTLAWTHAALAAGVPVDPNRFLQFINTSSPLFIENEVTAQAYYQALDPTTSKTTLQDFKRANGLDVGVDALAVYINNADLGFGRRMYIRTNPDQSVGSCVENYGDNAGTVDGPDQDKLNNAKFQTGLIATVCMEYSGTPGAVLPATPVLLAENNNKSSTTTNSSIVMALQPGNYTLVAATAASGKHGAFSLTTVLDGVTIQTNTGRWFISGGQKTTSLGNPSFPLIITKAGTATIDLKSSTVDTYLYLLQTPSNIPLAGRKFTKFYAYNSLGERITNADLDGRGAKYMPGLCNVCHGGTPKALEGGVYPDLGDTNTQFLPWDLDTFVYDTDPAFTRAALEPQFKIFNKAVLTTYPKPTTVSWRGNVAIPDNTGVPVSIPLTVSGVKGPITQLVAAIDHDNQGNPGIMHPNGSELMIKLVPPTGPALTFSFGDDRFTGTVGANLKDVYISDEAEIQFRYRSNTVAPDNPRYAVPPYGGTWLGQGPMGSIVNGTDPNGIWTLQVSDLISGNTGTVRGWSLYFNGVPEAAYRPAPVEMIQGWYGGPDLPNATFNGNFVPPGWQGTVAVNGQLLNKSELYLGVIAPTCRACHAQRSTMRRNEVDFSTYDKFVQFSPRVTKMVFDQGLMPMARRTYQNHFWSNNGARAAILGKFLGVDVATRQPGRPIANAGPSRALAGNPSDVLAAAPLGLTVKLNGKGSMFASTFQWSLDSKPLDSIATLADSTTSTPSFTPDIEGDYSFSLVVGNGNQQSVSSQVNVSASTSAGSVPLSFTNEIYAIGIGSSNTCVASGCHMNNRGPNYTGQEQILQPGDASYPYYSPDRDTMFRRILERVDLNDPAESLVLRKTARETPHAGDISDLSLQNKRLLRWIMEGANNN